MVLVLVCCCLCVISKRYLYWCAAVCVLISKWYLYWCAAVCVNVQMHNFVWLRHYLRCRIHVLKVQSYVNNNNKDF